MKKKYMRRIPEGKKEEYMKRLPEGKPIHYMEKLPGNGDTIYKNERTKDKKIEEIYKNDKVNTYDIQHSISRNILGTNNSIQYNDQVYFNDNGRIAIINKEEKIKIANFIVRAIEIIIEDDGITKNTYYVMECVLNGGQKKKIVSLESRILDDSEWIKTRVGGEYYLYGEYKKLEILIAEQFRDIVEKTKYIHVGWRKIDNRWCYLHGSTAIGLNSNNITGDNKKIIQCSNKISQLAALELELNLLNLSKNLEKTLIQLLYSHLAVMKQLFVEARAEPQFLLWIYGSTG